MTRRWCLSRLRELLSGRDLDVVQADITGLDGFVGLSPGVIHLGRVEIDESRAAEADLTDPVLVVNVYSLDGEFLSALPVSGWEQIWRARTLPEPLDELPAIMVPDALAAATEIRDGGAL